MSLIFTSYDSNKFNVQFPDPVSLIFIYLIPVSLIFIAWFQ